MVEIPPTGDGPGARYFTREGEAVQVVYNLKDPAPYLELGYVEVDEDAYLASLPDPAAEPAPALDGA